MRTRKLLLVLGVMALVLSAGVAGAGELEDLRAELAQLKADGARGGNQRVIDIVARIHELLGPLGGGSNDQCAGAIALSCDTVNQVNNIGAATDFPWSCGLGGADVFFTIEGNGGQMEVNTCGAGTDYDTTLALATGGCGALNEDDCNDDTCGLQSQLIWNSVDNTTYWIVLGGFASGEGNAELALNCEIPVELEGFDVEK